MSIHLECRTPGKQWGAINRFHDENINKLREQLLAHVRGVRDNWMHTYPRKEYRIIETGEYFPHERKEIR